MNETRPRNIKVVPLLNGFLVEIGCQNVVFTSIQDLLRAIGRYYADPAGVSKEFVDNALNKTINPQPVIATGEQLPTDDRIRSEPSILRGPVVGSSVGGECPPPTCAPPPPCNTLAGITTAEARGLR